MTEDALGLPKEMKKCAKSLSRFPAYEQRGDFPRSKEGEGISKGKEYLVLWLDCMGSAVFTGDKVSIPDRQP
jgi:hypothetical protein